MDGMTELEIKAISFWQWFQTVANDLFANPTRADLVSQINLHVDQLGPFDWEIGPLEKDKSYFAVSPKLDETKLQCTRRIVELAPVYESWNFLPSKPPKQWQGIWKMNNEFGRAILIDSSNWEYILYQFEDGTFDMDILLGEIEGDLNTCHLAVDIALTGYLGEETFMELIPHVTILKEIDNETERKLTKLKFIKKHIDDIG